jgi:hypothetical protein
LLPLEWIGGAFILAVNVFYAVVSAVVVVLLSSVTLMVVVVIFTLTVQLYLGDRLFALTGKLTSNPSIKASPLQSFFFWCEVAGFVLFAFHWLS